MATEHAYTYADLVEAQSMVDDYVHRCQQPFADEEDEEGRRYWVTLRNEIRDALDREDGTERDPRGYDDCGYVGVES